MGSGTLPEIAKTQLTVPSPNAGWGSSMQRKLLFLNIIQKHCQSSLDQNSLKNVKEFCVLIEIWILFFSKILDTIPQTKEVNHHWAWYSLPVKSLHLMVWRCISAYGTVNLHIWKCTGFVATYTASQKLRHHFIKCFFTVLNYFHCIALLECSTGVQYCTLEEETKDGKGGIQEEIGEESTASLVTRRKDSQWRMM